MNDNAQICRESIVHAQSDQTSRIDLTGICIGTGKQKTNKHGAAFSQGRR